ncbi:MAG TPA: hypothetical protein VF326_01775 [Anaerolineaceae bacterium]
MPDLVAEEPGAHSEDPQAEKARRRDSDPHDGMDAPALCRSSCCTDRGLFGRWRDDRAGPAWELRVRQSYSQIDTANWTEF